MPRKARPPRLPFVMTVSAVAAVAQAACGGETGGSRQTPDTGGTGGTGTGGSAGAGVGGTAGYATGGWGGSNPPYVGGSAGMGVGGVGGSGGAVVCPPSLPDPLAACPLAPGQSCAYDVSCQSGPVALTFTCGGPFGGWTVLPTECASPHDSCAGTSLHCDGTWTFSAGGTNPPAPCPEQRPVDGATCRIGEGGDWQFCGYACTYGDMVGWSLSECRMADAGTTATWVNGPCEP